MIDSDMTKSLITFKAAKSNFLDRPAVENAVGKARAGALRRAGAYIHTAMRRSIRPARRMKLDEMPEAMQDAYRGRPARERPLKSSEPGEAPRGRTRRLRKSILYALDPRSQSVLIGPTKFPGSRSAHAPRVLEEGGRSWVTVLKTDPSQRTGRPATKKQAEGLRRAIKEGRVRRRARRRQTVQVAVRIKPRPYIAPALKNNLARVPREFKNVLRVN